ncbi:MAG TPA: Gldg family protein [Myxococcota bacterium]|nr:Gldg family protein [Myxococcota bacterium]
MSPSFILTLVGLAGLYAGQRLFSGDDSMEMAFTGLGGLLLVLGLFFRFKAMAGASAADIRGANQKALIFNGVVVAAVAVYALSTDSASELIALDDQAASRWSVAWSAVWPIVLLAGLFPLLLIDLAIVSSPLAVQPLRVKQAIDNGLVGALGLCLVFPLNYLATEHNERWDLAYFKTTEVGGSSQALVTNLTEPVTARIFLPTSSDVRSELVPYFEELEAANPAMFRVEVLDHAAEPVLAKELKIRDNGYVALTLNDGTDDAVTKSWKIGDELDRAKRNLKKLDQEFQKRLLDLAKGERKAYFTVGHGEFNWKSGDLPDDKLVNLKKLLQTLNFDVKELGLKDGLGDEIPDDATVVFVVGPEEPFLPAENEALKAYIDGGGALVVAVEPGRDPMVEVLGHVGVKAAEGTLASEAQFLRRSGDKSDRMNIVTNRYSSHESTTTLSKYSRQLHLVTPGAGYLEESGGGRGKVTVTVRSDSTTWADLDGGLEYDAETEKKDVRALAMAASGPAGTDDEGNPTEYRVLVTSDATMFSDLILANKANLQFVYDAANWVMGEEELSGTVENEEDIKIEHTQEDQAIWFYSTVMGLPLIILMLGAVRVRRRRSAGGAA